MVVKDDIFESVNGGNEFLLSDLLQFIKSTWYWFVSSVLICCAIAGICMKGMSNEYLCTAIIMIKEESKESVWSESAAFEDLHVMNVKRSVDNELIVFKSKQLMNHVVNRLYLDISYTVKKGLRTDELYTRSPVVLRFPDAEDTQTFSLEVTPLSGMKAVLSAFSDHPGKEMIVSMNDTVVTPLGRITVAPSRYYTEDCFEKPVLVTKYAKETMVLHFRNRLQVKLVNKSATTISLSLKDISPERGEEVLDALVSAYNETILNDKNKVVQNTSAFINERLAVIEQDLNNVDTDIELYKRENRLTDIQSETEKYLKESSQYTQDELNLQNQRTVATYILNYLTDPVRSSQLIPANTGISDANIESQIHEYNTILLKRDRLIGNSSSQNPIVKDLNNSLNAMRPVIIHAMENLIAGLNIQIGNIRAKDTQTSQLISEVPTQQRYVLSVERQQKIKEELYLYLLKKREENAISQTVTENNVRIIDPAFRGMNRLNLKRLIVLLGAMATGIALPSIFFWLTMVLNTKVLCRKDVEDAITVPYLGEIPLRDKKNRNQPVAFENTRDTVCEAFRIIRTNLALLAKTDTLQVLAFTSFEPGAGKTFVSKNLALSIALTNRKVIWLDLDMRRGTSFGELPSAGISGYLSGTTDHIGSLIQRKKFSANQVLDMIPSGPVPPNPAELLLSERLEVLIKILRKHYHYILLDNVCYGHVADAAIANRVADMTVFVGRAGLLDKRRLPELEKLYRQEKLRNLSFLLNAADRGTIPS
jgi:capsular exopolysaccharide synthesis family protein